jgi:hypothetical protein
MHLGHQEKADAKEEIKMNHRNHRQQLLAVTADGAAMTVGVAWRDSTE